ncbi:MAG TPA: ribosome biogenesis GTP-binding protein YihA/YsxC [Chitinophagaceae bacterium]|nr:ribosome biogenesis GTP-binding protein YihA/YsxC [Chitinophagaceae bacterium]
MEVINAHYVISSPSVEKCPKPDRPEYAFIGRSNVGKSSLINMLCNKREVAKISSSPGKTQLINHFDIESADKKKWYLVDLPGYGFAKRSQAQRKTWKVMIDDYIRNRENLGTLFVLLDSRLEPQKIDLDFVNRLGEWQVPFALVFTKSDKVTQREVAAHVKSFLDAMREAWEYLPQHFVTSSEKGVGGKKLLSFISGLNDAYYTTQP